MKTPDYYSDAFDLAQALAGQGYPEWGAKLRESVETGFTATEILMALRWTVNNILSSKIAIDAPTRKRLEVFLNDLAKTLS